MRKNISYSIVTKIEIFKKAIIFHISMALVEKVSDYFRNVVRGGKDIIKREIGYEVLETIVVGAASFYGTVKGVAYAAANNLAGYEAATSIFGFTGLGFLLGHLVFLPFDIYKGVKNAYEAVLVGLGQPATSAGHG